MSGIQDQWSNNIIQFTRLLAEIQMAGLDPTTMGLLRKSMNVADEQIHQILERAAEVWETMKVLKPAEKVTIRWGDRYIAPEPIKDRTLKEYKYYTLEEMNAFLNGVGEAVGWTDHEQIDHPVPCKKCDLIFDESTLKKGYCENCIQDNPECLEDCSSGGPDNCTGCMD